MKATIEIDMDNPAFLDAGELTRILQRLVDELQALGNPSHIFLFDKLGNKCGDFRITT